MQIETFASGAAVVLSANATDASFPSRPATKTRPSGAGVIDLANNGNITPNALRVQFYGTDTADQTFKCRILGWNKIPRQANSEDLYIACVLCEVTCTLGTGTGVANTPVNSSQLIVDTITLATGFNDDVDVSITSPTGNIPAHLILDTKGCELVEFIFDRNSSAASANAIVGRL
jgi:hypothetical protein